MEKRGQAASEFLMSYGWAVLVILASVSALAYFGVLSPNRFIPDSCILEPGVACTDARVNENGVVLILQNGIGDDLDITAINVGGCSGTTSGELEDGAQAQFIISGCANNAGEKFRSPIIISYTGRFGLPDRITGNIVAKVESGGFACNASDVKADWHFDESSGVVRDSSFCNNHGTNYGAVQGVAGKSSSAIRFDDSGDYVSIPASSSLDITGDLTITMWVQPAIDSSAFHNSWNFFIYQRSPLKYEIGFYNTGGPRFKPYNDAGTNFDFNADVPLSADTWYHLAFVRSGTFFGIYVDGTLADSRNDFSGELRSSTEVRIGGNGGSGFFNGTIDEVTIYSRALSASEISTDYTK